MPEKGRPSASSGNVFHDVRVVHCAIDLLEDATLVSIGVETFDATDDIVVLRMDGPPRHEQVKERAPNGKWTAARLVAEGVMGQFVQQHRQDPECDLVLFTGSDASIFREAADRARNARANHGQTIAGRADAEGEWRRRLGGRTRFIDDIVAGLSRLPRPIAIGQSELFGLMARVKVEDSSGSTEQLRGRAIQRLKQLVDRPARAVDALESLAREAAIRRLVITRQTIEATLTNADAGSRRGAFALAVDVEGYTTRLRAAQASIDVAKLRPIVPRFQLASGAALEIDTVNGRTLILGGHGSGKSRCGFDLAITAVESGRRCLHTRLAKWATNLWDLLMAELSIAAARSAGKDDVTSYVSASGLIVLDGLDEVPSAQRGMAEREILQFADSHPHLALVVSSRPGSAGTLAQQFVTARLQPLTTEQVDLVLGKPLVTLGLSSGLMKLAKNPLMLGLLARSIAEGEHPDTEADLLDAWTRETVAREVERMPRIDDVSGLRLAEDAAFEWLASGRVSLDRLQLRQVSAAVALLLGKDGLLASDGSEVERWLIEAGIAVSIEGGVVPVHRTLLDHLAGRAIDRRDEEAIVGRPQLREAVARYIGAQGSATDKVLTLLTKAHADLELLSRVRYLTQPDIVWPLAPQRFAEDYVGALRSLGNGPLVDIGVLGQAVKVEVDSGLTWISEWVIDGPTDIVQIVDAPQRMYTRTADGRAAPVLSVSMKGYRGQEIGIRLPQLAAFARVRDELRTRVRTRALPREGPEVIYERLCGCAQRFLRTVTAFGTKDYKGFRERDFKRLSSVQLLAEFTAVAAANAKNWSPAFLRATAIVSVPPSGTHVVAMSPSEADSPFHNRLCTHGGLLLSLVERARAFGIDELPLHPLGILPDSESDPIASLPGDAHAFSEGELALYICRLELRRTQAFRYLVENNLRGLRPWLSSYSRLPWRTEIVIEDRRTETYFDVGLKWVTRRGSTTDEVEIVSRIVRTGALWAGSSLVDSNESVLDDAYKLIQGDLDELFGGREPLGFDVL